MRILSVCMLALAACLTYSRAGEPVKTRDWPQWRGPERNAISTETGLLREWPKGGPTLLWDSRKANAEKSVGAGISSLAIVQGKIYTLGDLNSNVADKKSRTGEEYVFCIDAENGKELWKTKLGPSFFNGNGNGPRSTPTVDGDRLYVLTPHGQLACLKTSDGALVWKKDMKTDFGGRMMSGWGFSESPTIDGNNVVCTPGGKKAIMAALNKLTGETVWTCQPPTDAGAGYASITTAEVSGIKQYVTMVGPQLGLIGVDANTGKFLWNYKKVANGTANCPTALIHGDFVFSASGYGQGAALLKLSSDGQQGIKAEEVYFLKGKELQNHHGGMVMIGDYIYGGHGHGDGKPFCVEWKSGEFAWGPERGAGGGSAAVLYADGHLYFRYQSGEMALIEATPKVYKLKSSFNVPTTSTNGGRGWPHPVIYQGKLYLRGEDQILCYDLRRN
jgi:outer membrane protein assembly factor BamB